MSRRKSSYRRRSSGSDNGATAGIIAAVVLLLLAVAMVVVAAIGSSGFKEKDFRAWFNHWGKGNEVVQGGKDLDDETALSSVLISKEESEFMKVNLLTIDPADYDAFQIPEEAEASYTLTVTLTGDYNNEEVEAEMHWKDPEPDKHPSLQHVNNYWASGKNVRDYAKFVQSEVGGHEFVLSALQPYGTPIVLKIRMKEMITVSCTVQLDYLKRYNLDGEGSGMCNVIRVDDWVEGSDVTIPTAELEDIGLAEGIGTVTSDFVMIEIKITDNAFSDPRFFTGYTFKSHAVKRWALTYNEAYAELGYPSDEEQFSLADFVFGDLTAEQRNHYLKLCHYYADAHYASMEPYASLQATIKIKTFYNGKLYGITEEKNLEIEINNLSDYFYGYPYDLPVLDPSTGNIIL